MPRLYVPAPLSPGLQLSLPAGPARHVQVLRLQPGDAVTLFNGEGGEWDATITRMGRSDVDVKVETHQAIDRELPLAITLAVGMPANERMDWLIEKATELGVARIQPLVCERSVLRLAGERAAKKADHWRGVAIAAAEQSGRTRVPQVDPIRTLRDWIPGTSGGTIGLRAVLSLQEAKPLPLVEFSSAGGACFLSGPEGGLTASEETLAYEHGFVAVSLGSRVLRAETAPLAALAYLGQRSPGP